MSETMPVCLKPYLDHGVDITYRDGQTQALGTCPFCGKEKKLYIGVVKGSEGLATCHSGTCAGDKTLNVASFLQKLHVASVNHTADSQLEQLRIQRRLLSVKTLRAWGVCRSIITGEWLVPAYNVEGKVTNLYHYTKGVDKDGKVYMYLRPTAGVDQAIFGIPLWKKDKPNVILAEGVWDAMALWEVLQHAQESFELVKVGVNGSSQFQKLTKFSYTGDGSNSLYNTTNVLATPGCGVFKDSWLPLFTGKQVSIPFDSDHPVKHAKTGATLIPAGYAGVKRISEKLIGANGSAPTSIRYLKWGNKGYDDKLPSGYDVRDAIAPTGAKDMPTRVQLLSSLFQRMTPIPNDWVPARTDKAKKTGGVSCDLLPCSDYRTLRNAWQAAMHWIQGLDYTLIVSLASILSTETVGDQVWLNVLSPPSTGKSVLSEALCMSLEYVHAESTIRGFISGYVTGSDKEEDNGLVPKIKGKTLVTKEGDALMNAPDLSRILSEARDLYDGALRAHYRHGVSRRYENIRFTWILCGTPGKMSKLDQSELGARFLRITIMERIDDDLEDDIGMRVGYRAYRNVKRKVEEKKAEGNVDEAMFRAKQLTGGYINHLRKNASEILERVEMTEDAIRHCTRLGRFVASLRARPSETQDESVAREFSARLVEQFVRLSMCVAGVLGKSEVDAETLRITSKVAFDTASGKTFELVKLIYPSGMKGVNTQALAMGFSERESKVKKLLEFLSDPNIRVCEAFHVTSKGGIVPQLRWRLTPHFYKLYTAVVVNSTHTSHQEI